MGRAFEYRKEKKFKRWANMAKTFTRIGREIAIAVKEGGAEPDYNLVCVSRFKTRRQTCLRPTLKIHQKASSKDAESYDEVVYEGYAPHGIALIVETATDNTNRTVANVRHVFNKYGGSLGTSGSVEFMFDRKGYSK
ncbi:MAG: YebC/PmpR family DNA-binding transcriptional regulator [Saprospiraceae bacterium]